MAIDQSKAFELPGNNGLLLGEGGALLSSDASGPIHDAPLGSIHVNTTTGLAWRKIIAGSGVDKWKVSVVYGTEFQKVEALAETSTTSTTTFSNKLTLTTPSLPLGDYLVSWQFQWRTLNANRLGDFRIQRAAANIQTWQPFTANIADRPVSSGFRNVSAISGIQTFTFGFKVSGTGTTVYTSDAIMTLIRTN